MIMGRSSHARYAAAIDDRLVTLTHEGKAEGQPLSPLFVLHVYWSCLAAHSRDDDLTLCRTPDGGIMAHWWRGDEQVASREFRQEESR